MFALAAVGVRAADVTVCADPDPPPWTTWVRDAEGKPTGRFVGFSVELVGAAFARIGKTVEFVGNLPWSRCLWQVENGAIDFAMDGYYSAERARRLAFSRHYNTLTPQVFYLAGRGVSATTKADLKRYRGCGMLGASYAHYGLDARDLEIGATATYAALLQKLEARRCDYFVEELEVMIGLRQLGRITFDPLLLGHADVSDAAPPSKHLLTALGGRGEKLLPALDAAIGALIDAGQAERMWRRWAPPDLPYRP